MRKVTIAPRRVAYRVGALAALMSVPAVVMAIHLSRQDPQLPLDVHPAWLFIGFFIAGTAPLLLEVQSNSFSLSLTEIPLVFGLLGASRPMLFLMATSGWLLSRLFDRRRSLMKLAFNVPLTFLEITVAATVFDALSTTNDLDDWRMWVRLLLALSSAIVLSTTAVNAVIVLAGDSMTWRRAARHSLLGLINALMATALMVLALIALRDTRAAVIPLVLLGAVAIVPMRRQARLQRRYDNLLLLHEFTKGLTTSNDLSQTLHSVLTETAKVLRTAQASIVLPRADTSHVSLLDDLYRGVPAIDDALWQVVVIERRGVCLARDSQQLDGYLSAHGIKDLMAVPLLHGSEVIGVLTVFDRLGDVSTFDRDDLSIFSTMANQTTVTLENLRLIDKLRLESAEREHQALHDELTTLPNRAHLYRTLDRRLQGGTESIAVAVLDLNQFKDVNDTLGHHAGDEVLVEAARRLRCDLPASAFVARLGGDEFAIVMEGFANADEAVKRMGALERVFAAPFELEDMTLRIDAAIGVAVGPEDGTDRTTLLKRADVAMYAAKKVHGSAVRRYDKTQEQTSGRNLEIVAALRAAMDSGHITLAFQPKADLASGRIPGVEALVRWNDPRLGVIPPNEFIPLAEQAGLIGALTDTVLNKALTACAQWTAAGRTLSVAVNVDAQTLLSPGFVTRVKSEIRRVGLSASALTLEITERELVRELNDAASVIGELRDYGIAFSIDDFGTGYSALSYLTRLPVDEIKIDRSFIIGVAESPDHAAIVKAIADMATSLSLTTVVEGIEDDATWKAVTRLGCTYGQGYHLARPMPNEQFMEWLNAHSPLPTPPGSAVGAMADLRDVVAAPILRAQKVAFAPAD